MSAVWTSVLVVGAGTVALKAVGPIGVSGKSVPPRISSLLSLVGPAILAALVVTETFASGRALSLDARLAGVGAGAVAVLLRAPLWVAVIAGAAATAVVRLVG